MKIASARIERVDTPIIPTIAAMVRASPGTISLGQGVVSYGPPPEAVAALPALMSDAALNKYQAVTGIAPLVGAIAETLRADHGIEVTAGSNSAFLNAVLAVADPGDEFILPMPYYFNQEMAVRMCGCVPVPVPVREDWQLDVDAIERAIVTVSPNNPTGAVYPESDLRRVNAIAAAHGLYHFAEGVQRFGAAVRDWYRA
jgi:aspartate/methionine/tyrosine aminotransferase